MQAEQGIAGMLAEIAEQVLVGFARQALAIVVELVGLEAGGGQGRGDVQAEPFGMAQVFQQGRNRGEPGFAWSLFLSWRVEQAARRACRLS